MILEEKITGYISHTHTGTHMHSRTHTCAHTCRHAHILARTKKTNTKVINIKKAKESQDPLVALMRKVSCQVRDMLLLDPHGKKRIG